MENTENTSQAMHLLAEAHRAWERMRPLREKRERNKNFTYGNQWCDMMTDEHGRRVSEWQHLRDNGKDPLTNNLIRQLVKSVVGRFRSRLAAEPAPAEPLHGNLVGELDSRLMEEFLISGCCFQRIDFGEEGQVALSNVSPSQMLFRGGDDPRCRDFDLVGQLHDMPLATLVERLSDGSRTRALDICRRWELRHVWRCYWLSPDGAVLSQYDSPYGHGSHPFALKLYPLTDGEVHSMVEDVIDQQKYVNRLVTLVDHVMGASAKGVLLYPDNILPEGFTWNDLRYAWSKPNGIVPYHPRGGNDRPEQVSGNATNIGAYEMVNLQMRLFEQISGVSGALQGQASAGTTGAQLYESQVSNSTIALGDIFETFDSFRRERDRKAAKVRGVKKL